MSLQLLSLQSIGDVRTTQLDWKRVPQARSRGCRRSVAITTESVRRTVRCSSGRSTCPAPVRTGRPNYYTSSTTSSGISAGRSLATFSLCPAATTRYNKSASQSHHLCICTSVQSNLSKWILLKLITHLNGYHLSGPV